MLEQQIQSKLQQISSLRSLATSVQSFAGNEPVVHNRNVTALEDVVIKIIQEEEELNQEIDRLVDLKREIRDTIADVKDLNQRLVLEKRHLCFLTWEQIAKDLGHTERWAQMKQQQALMVVQQILDRRVA